MKPWRVILESRVLMALRQVPWQSKPTVDDLNLNSLWVVHFAHWLVLMVSSALLASPLAQQVECPSYCCCLNCYCCLMEQVGLEGVTEPSLPRFWTQAHVAQNPPG